MSNPATDGQSDSSTKLRKVTICTGLSGILTMADDLGWSKEQRQSLEPLIAQLRSKETPSDGPVVYMSDTNGPNGFFMLNASRNSDGMTDGIGIRHYRWYQIDPKDANSDENGRPTWTASQERQIEYYDSIEPTMRGEWASYKHGLRCALRDQLVKSKF